MLNKQGLARLDIINATSDRRLLEVAIIIISDLESCRKLNAMPLKSCLHRICPRGNMYEVNKRRPRIDP